MSKPDTTIYCDGNTYGALKKIAYKNNRSIIGQIRHWIDGEKKR